MRNVGRFAALTVVMVSAWVRPSGAQLNLSKSQRAADGTVYEVVYVPNSALLSGADEVRVTTIAGSVNGLSGCSGSNGGLSALAGADPVALQALHNFADIRRTSVLSPNDINTINFNPNNGGRLTVGTGGGAIDICRVSSDCTGGASDASVVTLDTADAAVPAACIASGVQATCAGPTSTRTTFAFGLPRNGANACTSGAPTTNLAICGALPSDGFTLGKGQVIVFIYNHTLGMSGFTEGVGGFGIDTDNSNNPGCSAGQAVTADAQTPSAPNPIAANCGDGIVSPGEQCDDGNKTNGDTCDNNCTLPGCGNGIVDSGEQCDDGNKVNGDTCDNNCTPPGCGNGIVDAGEECDDGNHIDGDGCNSNCTVQAGAEPPPGGVAPAMGPLGGLITAAGLLLAGGRVLRRR